MTVARFFRLVLWSLLFVGCQSSGPRTTPASPALAEARAAERTAAPLVQARPTHAGKIVLFGNTHSHSTLSDDVTDSQPEVQPLAGFQYAKAHGLDFLAISDHHMGPGAQPRFALTADEYENKLYKVAVDFNTVQNGAFIAVPAIEWGTEAVGNHVNIFASPHLPPEAVGNADYQKLFEWAKLNNLSLQFNHPDGWSGKSNRRKDIGNYGEALYADQGAFRDALTPSLSMVSIITSVRGGHLTGKYKDSEEKSHREMGWENYYKHYLNMGLHVSPSADQDTHRKNFGTVTAARTAAWADGATLPDLLAAFKAHRVYATEDDEMVVAFQVKYKDKLYWMGETVPLQTEEADVELVIKVWQAQGVDNDLVDEGPYTVEIIADPDGIGGLEASKLATTWTAQSGQELLIPFTAGKGKYLYLHVKEQGGKDNLIGDGDDLDGDGKRDNLNDSAWTSAIWFDLVQVATFVWSKNSDKYHNPDCWAVKSIGAANRREGPAPEGKTKHDCHP